MTSDQGFSSAVPPVGGPTYPTPTYPASTSSATASGYPNSSASSSAPSVQSGHTDEPSTADIAKDQAASVAGGAADAAKNVAGVAKEQAGQVASEAKKQVKDLVGQARTELTDQAGVQQQRVAGGLRSVGDQIRSMAEGATEQGPAVDLAHQAADKVYQIAEFLENRDPGSVLNEVRSFARKQPGVFLALSLGAGVLVGRLARGLTADTEDNAPSTTPTPGSGHSPGSVGGVMGSVGYVGTQPRPALGSGVPSSTTPGDSAGPWPSDVGFNR